MQVVGKLLTDHALLLRGESPDDVLFVRSAFNRYYYATFLRSRALVQETTGTHSLPHKALPEYLTGQFRKIIKRQIQESFKSGVLNNANRARLLSALNENTMLLSGLLSEAYSVRVLADYEPDVAVEVKADTYSLGAATLSSAGNWANRAQMHCKNLHKVWKDLGN
jgi:hypothetical protein